MAEPRNLPADAYFHDEDAVRFQLGSFSSTTLIPCRRCGALVFNLSEQREQHVSYHRGWWVGTHKTPAQVEEGQGYEIVPPTTPCVDSSKFMWPSHDMETVESMMSYWPVLAQCTRCGASGTVKQAEPVPEFREAAWPSRPCPAPVGHTVKEADWKRANSGPIQCYHCGVEGHMTIYPQDRA